MIDFSPERGLLIGYGRAGSVLVFFFAFFAFWWSIFIFSSCFSFFKKRAAAFGFGVRQTECRKRNALVCLVLGTEAQVLHSIGTEQNART